MQMPCWRSSRAPQRNRDCRTRRTLLSISPSSSILAVKHMRRCTLSFRKASLTKFSYLHSTRGFYYHHMAIIRRKKEGLTQELVTDHMKSSLEYLKAASSYPPDDEKHACELPKHCQCSRPQESPG